MKPTPNVKPRILNGTGYSVNRYIGLSAGSPMKSQTMKIKIWVIKKTDTAAFGDTCGVLKK